MRKRIVRSVDGKSLPHANCRFCHFDIVQAPDVGWLNPARGDTYDLCASSPYGDHEPADSRGDLSTRSGPFF